MIVEFGTIENAHEHLEELKPNKARESLREHYDLAQNLARLLLRSVRTVPWNLRMKKAKLGIFIQRKLISSVNSWNLRICLTVLTLQLYRKITLEQKFFTCAVILQAQKHCLRKLLRKIISVWHCFLIKKAYMALE